jgi:hypothetical protein
MKDRQSLIPKAQKNVEQWKKLLDEATCIQTDARNLREDIEHSKDELTYFQDIALETICRDLRQDKNPVFYCMNQANCIYKRDSVRIKAADGRSFDAPVCYLAYDYLRLKGLLK